MVLCTPPPHVHVSIVEIVIGEVSPIGAYLVSLFEFTLSSAEVLQERGSAPGLGPTSMGSGIFHRD